jgi:hypothetical protein
MIKTYTEFCQGKLGADFTGVVHSDVGKLNYGAVVNGALLTMKNGRNRWFASASAARLAIKAAQPAPSWKQRALAATSGSQFGAIVAAALGEEIPAPCFRGRPSITSDGYLMCDFVDRDGNGRMGAFVGSLADVVRNTCGLADHLGLKGAERADYVAAISRWVGRSLEVA